MPRRGEPFPKAEPKPVPPVGVRISTDMERRTSVSYTHLDVYKRQIVKIILGGASNSRDLQDLTTLIGERDEITDSTTVGDHGSRTAQRSIRRVPIMPPDVIRTLPFLSLIHI